MRKKFGRIEIIFSLETDLSDEEIAAKLHPLNLIDGNTMLLASDRSVHTLIVEEIHELDFDQDEDEEKATE